MSRLIDNKLFNKEELDNLSINMLIVISILFNSKIEQGKNDIYYFIYKNHVYFKYDKKNSILYFDKYILLDLDFNDDDDVNDIFSVVFEYKLNLIANKVKFEKDGLTLIKN